MVDAFRSLGCSVLSLAALGKGVPDLLVAINGNTTLIEIKSGNGKENDLQIKWAADWKGARSVVWTTQDAANVVKLMRSSIKNDNG